MCVAAGVAAVTMSRTRICHASACVCVRLREPHPRVSRHFILPTNPTTNGATEAGSNRNRLVEGNRNAFAYKRL